MERGVRPARVAGFVTSKRSRRLLVVNSAQAFLFLSPMYTLGIDYGTNSVRALVVRCADGKELGSSVVNYPSGQQGILLDPRDHHLARQHPGDYLFGLQKSVKGALAQAKKQKGFVNKTKSTKDKPFLFVGRLVEKKGISILIKTFDSLN